MRRGIREAVRPELCCLRAGAMRAVLSRVRFVRTGDRLGVSLGGLHTRLDAHL